MLKREYKRREPTNQERIFLKSRGLIPDSWLIIYENKSELVVVSRRRSYRKVLKKASEILNDLGTRLWQDGCDEEGVFFSDLGGGIENALEGDYWMP